ncbi:MAG: hypothetical protein CFE29_18030 [Bradyrhizobiaceae bacterium PARB1]|nr:MAG: hypothetical protein CFE29_18030 [Bradyrhizobiaceae bacterium PARB1]
MIAIVELTKTMSIAAEIFQNDPDATAFLQMDGARTTYRDARRIVCSIALEARLHESGADDRIALLTPRGKDGVLAFLAVSTFAICCPLDPRLLDEELSAAISDLGIALIVDLTGEERISRIALAHGLDVRSVSVSDLKIRSEHELQLGNDLQHGDIALLLQTSGTTSKPKHVALTHANVLAAAASIGKSYEIGSSDICINPMPHHHVHGLISAGISSLLAGAAQFCAPSFTPAAFDEAFDRLRPTWFTGSPAFHLGLLDFYKTLERAPPQGSLRFMRSSSAPFPASAIGDYESLFGVPLLENYGMTETASTVCSNLLPTHLRKAGSVGVPIGAEVRIVDDAGEDVLAGTEGAILLRGASVITGYASGENGPEFFAQGWLRTGDVGHVDHDGFLFILGRTKELIKRGGHSVYPLEIDSSLLSHPDVAEAISFSIPHPTLGEELVAAIVVRAGSDLSGDDVRQFLKNRISTYKIPAAVLRVAAIPKSATGKTARRSMRDAFASELSTKGALAETETELVLLRIWREIVGSSTLGVTDNLFVHGADPIRAQRACLAIAEKLKCSLIAKDIIRNPTVRQQASILTRNHDIVVAVDT